MGTDKNKQIAKSTRRAVPANVPRTRTKDQAQDVRAKLISAVSELHAEVERLDLAADFRKWKIGSFLFALKSLSGHGNFRLEFELALGHVFGYRQAQRYMANVREIASLMPLIRARLKQISPEVNQETLSDEDILRELPPHELTATLSAGKGKQSEASSTLALPVTQGFMPAFSASLAKLFSEIECLLSSCPIAVNPAYIHQTRIGVNPLDGLTALPQSVIAVAGLDRQPAKWLTELLQVTVSNSDCEALVATPVGYLSQVPRLFDFPDLLTSSSSLFTLPLKQTNSNFLLTFVSRPERCRDFESAFANFGTVKLPINDSK